MSDEKSVVDGVPTRTSASAMQRADRCLRQWYYRYVLGLPDKPPGKGVKRGKEGHQRIEHYLKTGEDVLDKLERRGLAKKLIPTPGPAVLSEVPIEGVAGKLRMVGSIDCLDLSASPWQITVTDWKFKKDLDAYACKSEELVDPAKEAGIQMLGYAANVLKIFHAHGPQEIVLRHVTFQTEGRPDVVESRAALKAEEIKTRWAEVTNRIVPQLFDAAQKKSAQLVAKNESACEKYGGCPYKSTCQDKMTRLVSGFRKAAER